jgi:hypothetical protein
MTSILCRQGITCAFRVKPSQGIAAQYTRAKFQVRAGWDPTLPALLSVDETNGITITPDNGDTLGNVYVFIGATATAALTSIGTVIPAAELRLYNPDDADDCIGWAIPFKILPEAVA